METSSVPPRSLYRGVLLFGGFLIAVLFVARYVFPGRTSLPSDLPRIYSVPSFALTERGGQTITNNELFGKIWIADFVYTTCPGPCPLVSAGMAKIQVATASDPVVQLVTITVDPKNDTPAVLSDYANKLGADKNRWWFLTGSEKAVDDLIRDGFREPVVDNRDQPSQPGQFAVTHSTQLALVDANGIVRGFYDGLGPDGRSDLLKAVGILEKESNLPSP